MSSLFFCQGHLLYDMHISTYHTDGPICPKYVKSDKRKRQNNDCKIFRIPYPDQIVSAFLISTAKENRIYFKHGRGFHHWKGIITKINCDLRPCRDNDYLLISLIK